MTTMTTLSALTGDYVLDPARTRIGFVAKHTLATRVRGRFEEFEGGAHLDGDDPSRSGVRLTIRAASIDTGNRRRDDQLRDMFLHVADHPTLTFTSTGVRHLGGTGFAVTGALTIRGVTKPVTVNLELTGTRGESEVSFTGGVTLDRNDWGVNANAATRVMVSPKVALELDVAAIRRA
ncbi:YceI family protein [Nonomuraea roseoviolacea]|uniref:Polyisoprenoid-binding protein YceI n=1 Tax=Nonomuraea roseoviolacea subsp. carminata TaxID=160689 RepID=A0ABT1KD73_9ACTN|nr:YceI family protein [Nonomuraea roseoviolacea]MCP2351910.1 polyisoprenoid-binding protein YceI [Nonomuraea roseoviolacea subsp. carminata]